MEEPTAQESFLVSPTSPRTAPSVAALGALTRSARRLLDHATGAIVILGRDGRVLLANEAICAILGRPKDEIVGKDWFALAIPVPQRKRVRETFDLLVDGRAEPAEYYLNEVLHGDGTTRVVAWHNDYLRGPDGVVLGTLSLGREVQPGTRAQQNAGTHALEVRVRERTAELAKANEALRAEVERRLRAEAEVKEHAEALRRSNAELEQFASFVSHDLKTPLHVILGNAELVSLQWGADLPPDVEQSLQRVSHAANRMTTLIDDLLAYARLDAEGQTRPVDCSDLVDEVLLDLTPLVAETGATVTRDELPVIRAYPAQLEQVFRNLIENALKFRSARAPRIHVGCRELDGAWEFSVADNGIGIEPRYQEIIFRVFRRLHAPTDYPGTGIGLAVCRKVVERHGGGIRVESTPGEGSTFRFTIPAVPPKP